MLDVRRLLLTSYFSLLTESGGGERVRTDDPLRARQVLSQLSYTPDILVGLGGLEPPTSRLSVVCSSQLSYRPSFGFDFASLAALLSSMTPRRSSRYACVALSSAPCQPDKSEPSHPGRTRKSSLTTILLCFVKNEKPCHQGLGLSKLNSRLSNCRIDLGLLEAPGF